MAEVRSLIESFVLGEAPSLTRQQVAEEAGVPLEVAMELWHLSGFPHAEADEIAFTSADATALELSWDLRRLGVLSNDRQAALVRTWGRSFARLAEWQVSLLADVAAERGASSDGDTTADLVTLASEVLPRVEALQSYMWRRHLASSANRLLEGPGDVSTPMAICFVDIVGYTARSKRLTEEELVEWVESFEDSCASVVVNHGGRVIKSLGDAVLFVCDTAPTAGRIALELVRRGADEEDAFPRVRAGLAFGGVVARLGDVFGPTVNIASRLTSVARPNTVLIDQGAADQLRDPAFDGTFEVTKLRRTSVKGYSRLQPYRLDARSAEG